MSLDEIIKKNHQSRASRSRGRGGGMNRGRGGGRGMGRGGGRGMGRGGGRGFGRGGSQSRPGTPGPNSRQSRSQSRGPRGRSQSRTRSRSRQQRRSSSRARSASRSRSQTRRLTPRGRAGLAMQECDMPQLIRNGGFTRGRFQNRLRGRNVSTPGSVHSRLGVTTRRGAANLRRPLAVAKRGISKRGRGLTTANRYSSVGLRSDQIIKEQRKNMLMRNNIIKSQTFTRTRNNSFNSASQLTVSVANDFARKRRNSVGSTGYLNKQSLAQLNNQFGGYNNNRRGPGSVKSMGSNRSNRSSRSNRSNTNRSIRSRGRGRGLGRKFVNKQMLNVKLQKEIAAIQGKTYGSTSTSEVPSGVNCTPTPVSTGQTLHQRFATT